MDESDSMSATPSPPACKNKMTIDMTYEEFARGSMTFLGDVIHEHFRSDTKVTGLAILTSVVCQFPSLVDFDRYTGQVSLIDILNILIMYLIPISRLPSWIQACWLVFGDWSGTTSTSPDAGLLNKEFRPTWKARERKP